MRLDRLTTQKSRRQPISSRSCQLGERRSTIFELLSAEPASVLTKPSSHPDLGLSMGPGSTGWTRGL